MIPYGKQQISEEDIKAVIDVLKSDFLTQGPKVPLFEKSVSNFTGSDYAVAVNSATSALHIACLSLEVGKGDLVWTSPISFVASSNCALYCGADVDFVDIDATTYNMCPKALEKKLVNAKKANKTLPKVVIPVHLSGQSCEMDKIHKLSQEFGFKIIEDASHAIGGHFNEKHVGACQYSDITVFSFHPVKIVTTAEGGMATTNSAELASKMILFRSHGVTRDPDLLVNEAHGSWYYEQIELGYNYRMTELQAALGITQISCIENFVTRRNEIAKVYNEKLKDLPIILPTLINNVFSAWHLYIIRLKLNKINLNHKQVFDKLRESGIGVNLHYIPIHTQPYYSQLGFNKGDFVEAEKYYEEAISIPLYSAMTDDQQYEVIKCLHNILS